MCRVLLDVTKPCNIETSQHRDISCHLAHAGTVVRIELSYNGLVKTYWLSMHLPYSCRHSGACCSSGWAIPIEPGRVERVNLLRPDGSWLHPSSVALPDVAGILRVSESGHCVFHRGDCEIQRAFGPAALPSACQHFPREVLIDARGVFVTLSHYCPTAADLLFSHTGPVAIVEGPPAVPEGEAEGLDARDVLPPLLTAGVLMDLDAYAAWEAHIVRELTASDERSADEVLTQLEADLAVLQRWRPGGAPLVDLVRRLEERPLASAAQGDDAAPIARRYLAARAFASWMPYQGGGVAAGLGSLRFALKVLGDHCARLPLKDAIRQTDLRIVHLLSRDSVAAAAAARQ